MRTHTHTHSMDPAQVFDCSCVFVEIPGRKKRKISKSEVEAVRFVPQQN